MSHTVHQLIIYINTIILVLLLYRIYVSECMCVLGGGGGVVCVYIYYLSYIFISKNSIDEVLKYIYLHPDI